jgi:hypothetical protein
LKIAHQFIDGAKRKPNFSVLEGQLKGKQAIANCSMFFQPSHCDGNIIVWQFRDCIKSQELDKNVILRRFLPKNLGLFIINKNNRLVVIDSSLLSVVQNDNSIPVITFDTAPIFGLSFQDIMLQT